MLALAAAAAAAAVSNPSVEVWFSVSGEMGLSNFLYADYWKNVMTATRQQLRRKQWKVSIWLLAGTVQALRCLLAAALLLGASCYNTRA
jgi:hypothetical protein